MLNLPIIYTLILLCFALFLVTMFFYKMFQLRNSESIAWREKFKRNDLLLDVAIKDLKELETKYRATTSNLERELVAKRVDKAANEHINSFKSNVKHIETTKHNNDSVHESTTKRTSRTVEKDIKPSEKRQKGIKLSESTMNALKTSGGQNE